MFTESEHILKEALGTFTKLYGEESVEVAEVLNHLGGTYYKCSQLQKSRYANSHYKWENGVGLGTRLHYAYFKLLSLQ